MMGHVKDTLRRAHDDKGAGGEREGYGGGIQLPGSDRIFEMDGELREDPGTALDDGGAARVQHVSVSAVWCGDIVQTDVHRYQQTL